MKVIFTQGIQGSGKSTWAKEFVKKNKDYVRICRDDLRNMRGEYWIPKQEYLITLWEQSCISHAIANGFNIVVDAMNLNPKYLDELKSFIQVWSHEKDIKFEYKDFTDVTLEECIKRDLARPNSVGEKVIRETWKKYLAPKIEPLNQNPELPHAIICDLDGTLALFGNKNPFERDFINDDVSIPVANLFNQYPHRRIIFSGRNDKFKNETIEWLKQNSIHYDFLDMRKDGDFRKDIIIKKEMFETHIKDKYYVDFVVDDRPQVIRLWQEDLGLFVFNVGNGEEF